MQALGWAQSWQPGYQSSGWSRPEVEAGLGIFSENISKLKLVVWEDPACVFIGQ